MTTGRDGLALVSETEVSEKLMVADSASFNGNVIIT